MAQHVLADGRSYFCKVTPVWDIEGFDQYNTDKNKGMPVW